MWSMDDNRHAESILKELTETDIPRLMLFADREAIQAVRTSSSRAEVAGRDSSRAAHYSAQEIKRNRQGLRRDELSSSEVLDVTVFNLGNLARQTIQHQAEPRMLRLIMKQTSHIMMLVEGTSPSVNQWDKKRRETNWHHWVGIRKAESGTKIRKLVTTAGVNARRSGMRSSRYTLATPPQARAARKCSHQPCSPDSLSNMQDQLCGPAPSLCLFSSGSDGRRFQRLQLQMLPHTFRTLP